jgi:hypothetical protein
VGVAEHRDVGDRRAVPHEPGPRGEVVVEHGERAAPDLQPPLQLRAARERAEARRADPAHDPLLLEGQPLMDLRVGEPLRREPRRAVREVGEDGAGLRERRAVAELEHRRLADGVQGGVRVGQRVAAEDVDRHALVGLPEQGEQEADLVAVAGGGVVVESHAPVQRTDARECELRARHRT